MSLTEQYKALSKQLCNLDNLLHEELEKYFESACLNEYSDYRQYTKDGVTIQISIGWENDWRISFPYDEDGSREIHGNGDGLKCAALEVLNKTYVFE